MACGRRIELDEVEGGGFLHDATRDRAELCVWWRRQGQGSRSRDLRWRGRIDAMRLHRPHRLSLPLSAEPWPRFGRRSLAGVARGRCARFARRGRRLGDGQRSFVALRRGVRAVRESRARRRRWRRIWPARLGGAGLILFLSPRAEVLRQRRRALRGARPGGADLAALHHRRAVDRRSRRSHRERARQARRALDGGSGRGARRFRWSRRSVGVEGALRLAGDELCDRRRGRKSRLVGSRRELRLARGVRGRVRWLDGSPPWRPPAPQRRDEPGRPGLLCPPIDGRCPANGVLFGRPGR